MQCVETESRQAVTGRETGGPAVRVRRECGTNAHWLRVWGSSGRGLRLASPAVVDCWIGVEDEGNRRLVRLAGRLSVAQVPELLGACADVVPVQLDLTELVSVDVAGIEALQRLRGAGATLIGAPGYLQLKLDSHTGATAAPLPLKRRPEGRDR